MEIRRGFDEATSKAAKGTKDNHLAPDSFLCLLTEGVVPPAHNTVFSRISTGSLTLPICRAHADPKQLSQKSTLFGQ
jgi:hypothetical protein